MPAGYAPLRWLSSTVEMTVAVELCRTPVEGQSCVGQDLRLSALESELC